MMQPSDTSADKRLLRQEIRRRKCQYTPEELSRQSQQIIAQLLSHPLMTEAQVVMLYYSLPDEVDTHQVVDRLVAMGKMVLLPVVISDTEMELRHYRSADDLQEGAYHIMEPCGELFTDCSSIDLAVIPGMAFTRQGVRLGRGKGYYDRMLPRLTQARTIGICFPFQVLEHIPTDCYDRPVDEVMTL